jgi:hypothetical protein
MDLPPEAAGGMVISAWQYQHDWSSDSESSDDDSSRNSSSNDDKESMEIPPMSKRRSTEILMGKRQHHRRYTAFQNEALNKIVPPSSTKQAPTNEPDQIRPTTQPLFTIPKDDMNKASTKSPVLSSTAVQQPVLGIDNEGVNRIQTPVVHVNDTNAAEKLHSPRPQRYFRPSVTASEQPILNLPLYNHEYVHSRSYACLYRSMTGSMDYDVPDTSDSNFHDSIVRRPGFESVSKLLADDPLETQPIYRKYEELRYRIVFHIQHELSEMEAILRRMDEKIQYAIHSREISSEDSFITPSEEYQEQALAEMKQRRTLLLGRIFEKIQQYGKSHNCLIFCEILNLVRSCFVIVYWCAI